MTPPRPHLPSPLHRIQGLLFGAAFGDALAAPVEFTRDPAAIRAAYPPDGPTTIHQGKVTDDTQMMIAVAHALIATSPLSAETLSRELRYTFTQWLDDPENNRAPGMTCLRACQALKEGVPWPHATIPGSKGCGANMRVQPIATVPAATTRAGAAQLQAAMTHGHATALAASDLTAHTLHLLLDGALPAELPTHLRQYVHTQRTTYHHAWLGDLWTHTPEPSPEDFIARGWDECSHALERALQATTGLPPHADPCHYSGEGWIAEEAFATGLLCFLLFPHDPVRALQLAATTSGDSDSIACITGSLLGAHLGIHSFPTYWTDQIEYSHELHTLARALTTLSSKGA